MPVARARVARGGEPGAGSSAGGGFGSTWRLCVVRTGLAAKRSENGTDGLAGGAIALAVMCGATTDSAAADADVGPLLLSPSTMPVCLVPVTLNC